MEHIDTVEGLEAALAAAKEAKQAVVVQVSGACALPSHSDTALPHPIAHHPRSIACM